MEGIVEAGALLEQGALGPPLLRRQQPLARHLHVHLRGLQRLEPARLVGQRSTGHAFLHEQPRERTHGRRGAQRLGILRALRRRVARRFGT